MQAALYLLSTQNTILLMAQSYPWGALVDPEVCHCAFSTGLQSAPDVQGRLAISMVLLAVGVDGGRMGMEMRTFPWSKILTRTPGGSSCASWLPQLYSLYLLTNTCQSAFCYVWIQVLERTFILKIDAKAIRYILKLHLVCFYFFQYAFTSVLFCEAFHFKVGLMLCKKICGENWNYRTFC